MLRALFTPTRQGFRSRWWMAMWWLTAVLAMGVVIALVLWISPPLGPDPSTGDVAVLCVVSLAAGLALFASSMLAMTWRADDFDVLAAASISVATAGVGVVVVALALPFRRSQTLRSQIDHHVRLLQRGVRPSTDAVTELCSLLRIGLGSAGMFAIPIVQPDKCERALYLYGHVRPSRSPAAARGGSRPSQVVRPDGAGETTQPVDASRAR